MNTLDIAISKDGDKALVTLTGRLDTNTAPDFEEAANKTINEGVNHLVVDMAHCDYVSSAGLRVIIALQKKLIATGSLVFKGVQPDVMEVFEVTGFSKILNFE